MWVLVGVRNKGFAVLYQMQSEVLRLLKEHGAGFLSTMSTEKNAYIILISLNHLFIAIMLSQSFLFSLLIISVGLSFGAS